MSVTINSLYRMEGYVDKHFGSVTHNGHTFDEVLVGSYDRLKTLLHSNTAAEYELNEIFFADIGLAKDDSVSGIFPLTNGQFAIDGTVHSETKIDDRFSMLDIYIQNGADFLAITNEDLGHTPPVGSRIRIIGKGLHVYPTFAQTW